jgi:hypothetical protein
MSFAKILNILPTFGSADHRTDGEKQNIEQGIGDLGRLPGILQISEVF